MLDKPRGLMVQKNRALIGIAAGLMLAALFMSSAVHATTDTVGGSPNDWLPLGTSYISASQITASSSGNLQSIGFSINSATAHSVFGIYSSNPSGLPDVLLGKSASTALGTGTGWHDLAVTGVSIEAGHTYWLTFGGGSVDIQTGQPINSNREAAYTYDGNLPSSWGTLTDYGAESRTMAARMTYETIATTTTTTSTTTTTTPQQSTFTSFSFLTKTNQLNVNWVTEFPTVPSVSVECTLNDAQPCNPFPYTGPAGGGGCTINAPVYNTAPAPGGLSTVANKLDCIAYDTARPSTRYENIINFYPYALEVSVPSTMSLTLGEQENLLITIKNTGTFTGTYSVSVTPTNPNMLTVAGGSQTTDSLNNNDVQQLYAKLTLLVSRQTTTANVVVSSVSQPAIHFSFPVSVRGTDQSLPEFDVYGLVQLVLLAAVLASFLF
jgi:hypothetical protein